MKALVLHANARTAYVQNVPKPSPDRAEILVEVKAVSLNPIDPLYVAHPLGNTGRVVGSDFAGGICEIGPEVSQHTGLESGIRVAGFLQGACSVNPRPGAFAEYLTLPWDLAWKIPDKMTLETAAGVSLVALTAAQGVWFRLGMPAPFEYDQQLAIAERSEFECGWTTVGTASDEVNVLIYGASTSVGLYAAQMARISAAASGKKVQLSGVASKARWPLLQAEPYNYDHLVDYHDADWPEQIRGKIDGQRVHYAYDGISEGDSVKKVASLLVPGGRMAIVRSREAGAWEALDLPTEPIYGAVWEGLGEEVHYQGLTVAKSLVARNFAVQFYKWLGRSIGSDLLPVPIRVMPGGLARVVEDGFALLGSGDMGDRIGKRAEEWMKPVSAQKLVYRI